MKDITKLKFNPAKIKSRQQAVNSENTTTKEMTLMEKIQVAKTNNKFINQDNLNKAINKENIVIKDIIKSTEDDYAEFEQRAWKKGEGYKFVRFPMMNKYLEGLDEGLYLFAAESNMGKTSLMTNMLFDLCTNPANKLFGLYFSLDDTKQEVIPRLIAMNQEIPIGVAAKPQRYINMINAEDENSTMYNIYLRKREQGLEQLKDCKNCFKIVDSNDVHSAEEMYTYIKQVQHYVKSIDPDMNIIVAVDAVDDIHFSNKGNLTTTETHVEIARALKDWSTELHIPIFGSRHLKKLGQNRRPTLDDMKDFLVA